MMCAKSAWHARGVLSALALALLAGLPGGRAQDTGGVAGVVVSAWDGAPLAGVIVTVRGTTLATQTDAAGRYQLPQVQPGDQALRFSKSGYATAVVTDARVLAGQTTTVNGNLRPEFYELEAYEVTAELFTEQTEKIMFERQKSLSILEAVGSDFLAKVGAGNAAESLSKVSGATIVEGKFAVIRGLNDRYVTTTLNGARIPSADPYRQSASLDLFPSQVIDRVEVAKVFTPDQPGTFTGGGIDIITKSFPEKSFVSFSAGAAYNTQATGNKHFLTYTGGNRDWAALDDGSRALPEAIGNEKLPPAPISVTLTSPTVFQTLSNVTRLDMLTRALGPTLFAPRRDSPPPNENLSIAGGGSQNVLGGALLGYFAGASYKRDFSFYEKGVSSRYQSGTVPKSRYDDARSLSVGNWSSMVNLALRPFADHDLGFTFFYNQNAVDNVRVQDSGFELTDPTATFRKFNLYWTERNLNTLQFKGEHRFPAVDHVKFDWLVALTETTQDEPDARFFNDMDTGSGPATGGNSVPIPSNPTRYFRALNEDNFNSRLNWTVPFPTWTSQEGAFKFGLFDSSSSRGFTDRGFTYPGGGGYSGDPNRFLTPDALGLLRTQTNLFASGPNRGKPRSLTFIWDQFAQSFDSRYRGELGVQAGYLMAEVPVLGKLRLVGGVRYETTDLSVHSESYRASTITGLFTNDVSLIEQALLPSAGVIHALTPKMNLRLNYSQTLARPSFREAAAYFSYDPVINDYVEGNPRLQTTAVDNYDIRWEWFPRPGELVSLSLFYKDLASAIERGDIKQEGDVITWFNRDRADIYGVEFETRKRLDVIGLDRLSLGGNVSFITSEARLTPTELKNKQAFFPNVSPTRPLYDQSDYVLNVDVTYDNTRSGTAASFIYNLAGPRIAITKLNTEDVYEQPAPTLDIVVSQRLSKRATLKFMAKNLLEPNIERTYGKEGLLLYDSYSRGQTFSLSLTVNF
jgi:outer membrane cobalamin receptor